LNHSLIPKAISYGHPQAKSQAFCTKPDKSLQI
jgi:hypothetical protein